MARLFPISGWDILPLLRFSHFSKRRLKALSDACSERSRWCQSVCQAFSVYPNVEQRGDEIKLEIGGANPKG